MMRLTQITCLWRHVIVPPELLKEPGAERPHALVHQHHVVHNLASDGIRQLLILEEYRCH